MRTLFGVPVETLAPVLAAVVVAALLGVGLVAVRDRVFFRIGVRNIGRRAGRSALIVVGLMLATTIIAAALGTGDSMGRNVRTSVLDTLGAGDEWVTAASAKPDVNRPLATTPDLTGFAAAPAVHAVEQAVRGRDLVDAVVPARVQAVAVQDVTARSTEPFVTLFAPDAVRSRSLGPMVDQAGRAVALDRLPDGSVLLGRRAADALDARPGDRLRVFAGPQPAELRVAGVVGFAGGGSPKSVLILPLARAASIPAVGAQPNVVIVSNAGGPLGDISSSPSSSRARPTTCSPRRWAPPSASPSPT